MSWNGFANVDTTMFMVDYAQRPEPQQGLSFVSVTGPNSTHRRSISGPSTVKHQLFPAVLAEPGEKPKRWELENNSLCPFRPTKLVLATAGRESPSSRLRMRYTGDCSTGFWSCPERAIEGPRDTPGGCNFPRKFPLTPRFPDLRFRRRTNPYVRMATIATL
jgi:hypothetical protein